MLDSTSKREFIREGLQHYPSARETVDFFQTTVMDEIFAAFESRADTSWSSFAPRRDADGNLLFGKFIGQVERYIQAWIEGTLRHSDTPNKCWIGLGMYWKPPRRPSSHVVVACHVSSDKGVPVPLADVPGRDPRVLMGSLQRRGDRRLFVEPGVDFDLREICALLLDAVDEAIGATVNEAS